MFAESLIETSWNQRARRGWMTLTSFGLQAVVVAAVLLFSLLQTVGMPLSRTVSTPISMRRRDPGPAPRVEGNRNTAMQIIDYSGPLMQPTHIPTGIPRTSGVPSVDPISDLLPYAGPDVGEGPNLRIPIVGSRPLMPVAPPPTKPVFRTSRILEGMLIHKVQPSYPALAKGAHIQGAVELAAIISKDGKIVHLQLISGHPLLVPAAIDAVSQWRYRPYVLNGDAIEVETRITVNFILAAN